MGNPGTRLLTLSLAAPVSALAWSPDGRYLAAVGTDTSSGIGRLAIVDTRDGGPPAQPERDEPPSAGIAISPDSRWLAIGGNDRKGVFSLPAAEERCTNLEPAVAQRVAFSPDGRFVASIGWTTGIAAGPQTWVYDAQTGGTVWRDAGEFDFDRELLALAYSPDGRFLAAIVNAESFLFDARTGERLATLSPSVSSVVFTPDSRVLVAGMSDGRCVLLDVENRAEVTGRVHASADVRAVAAGPDGRWFAAVVEPGPAVLDVATAQPRFDPRSDVPGCTRVVYSPDLRTVAVDRLPGGTPGDAVAVLDAATGRGVWADGCPGRAADLAFSPGGDRVAVGGVTPDERGYLHVLDTGVERVRVAHDSPVTGLAMARSAEPVVATVTRTGTVRSYRVRTGGDPLVEAVHVSPVTSVAISPDGMFVAIGCADGNARMVKLLFGALWEVSHGPAVNAVAISAAGDLVATACADRSARLLAAADGKEIARATHQSGVTAVAFSPDGTVLATASNRTTTLVDAATGQARHAVTGAGRVRALAFAGSGLLATANDDGRVQLLDPSSPDVLGTVTHPRPVAAVAFSSDGTLLATGGTDRTVRISRLTDGVPAEAATLPLPSPVVALAFHPAAPVLAVLTEEPRVSLLEPETGVERVRFDHPAPVRDLAFTADGTLLTTAGEDGVLRVFDARV